jgi:ankyrin repeat protein
MLTYIWAGGEYGSALQAAAYRGHLEIVKLLLDHNADVNLQSNELTTLELYPYLYLGGSALQAAAYQGYLEIVKLLLDHNANVNLQSNEPVPLELYAYLYLGRWRIWKCTSGSSISAVLSAAP